MRRWTRSAWRLGFVLGVLLTAATPWAAGQVQVQVTTPAPPTVAVPPGAATVPADLAALVPQLGEQVKRLAVDAAARLGGTPEGQNILRDSQELAQAVGEFQGTLRATNDLFQARQAYAGIDASWHHLRAQLSRANLADPEIAREAQGVAALDARIHTALSMNPLPADYYTGPAPPSGPREVKRLARALDDRAQALVAALRTAPPFPNQAPLTVDAVNLSQAVDIFHDGINIDAGDVPALDRNGYAGIAALVDRIDRDLSGIVPPPTVRTAWQTFEATDVLLRRALGLPIAPEDLPGTALPATGPSPLVALTDILAGQVDAFLGVFSQNARAVPEGELFLGDASRLQAAVDNFRRDVAKGFDTNRLAWSFRDIDAVWQRLARRTNRIARGQTGPNIQQVAVIGQTIGQIHQLLGIPGYSPAVMTNVIVP